MERGKGKPRWKGEVFPYLWLSQPVAVLMGGFLCLLHCMKGDHGPGPHHALGSFSRSQTSNLDVCI